MRRTQVQSSSTSGVSKFRAGSRHRPSAAASRIYAAATSVTQTQHLDFKVKPDAQPLFTPIQLGSLKLQHRVVMAPLTRCRAPDSIPSAVMATYYGQRASNGGLIIAEATAICPEGRGYPQVPGIWSQQQVEGWKPVVRAVKDKGGLMVCQIWHAGRASHPDYHLQHGLPVSASALPVGDGFQISTPKGERVDYPTPRALQLSEIPGIVEAFVTAARNAIAAGFDGVEVHGAAGYLLEQFWKDTTNMRTDEYGGSDVNKARLLLEVTEAVVAAIGPERVGIRLSPFNTYLNALDPFERALEKNVWLVKMLESRVPNLAYIHMIEPRYHNWEEASGANLDPFKEATSIPFLASGGFKREDAIAKVAQGRADAIVYGRYFISNPDLPKRLAIAAPFTKYDRSTFYTFGTEGYIDYPFLQEQA
eukprot:GHUV01005492.1.p1 GENE.GHUV01005492.1~~GHUV01005492.1.p1  ORF type:complete len:420 (+),score=69.73 GHUV01005492.1:216-1475(+)